MPFLLAASSVGFALAWLVGHGAPRITAVWVYVQTALLGPVVLSTFWSMINERFDPHTAKRTVSLITGGGNLGGVLGGALIWRAASVVEPLTVLGLLAALNALAFVGALVTGKQVRVDRAANDDSNGSHAVEESTWRAFQSAPFLQKLACLVALGSAVSALLDYIFAAQASASFGKGAELLSFFSLFWLGVGAVSFFLQLAFGRVLLEKLGLAVNIAILPGIIVLGGAFGLAIPGLASASLLRGAEAVQRNTLFRTAYELLYTPISESRKRATKAVIDIGFDRLGTVIGSGLVLLTLHTFPRLQQSVLLGAVVTLALLTLPLTQRLHVGYVETLKQGLQAAADRLPPTAEELRSSNQPDPRPQQQERDQLIESVERFQPGGLGALLEAQQAEPAPTALPNSAAFPREALTTVQRLMSANDEHVTQALTRLEGRGPGVACAIQLLAHPRHQRQALTRLSELAPVITGQLLDALLDAESDFIIRRRIPRALCTCPTQRVVDGLLLGIADQRFEVRYTCGRVLLKLTELNPQLVISLEKATDAIRLEIDSGKRVAESATFEDDSTSVEESKLVAGLVRDRVSRSLEHVFAILSLLLEREPLRLAFRALHDDDVQYRGTALEYLETVLPPELRELIWTSLGGAAPLGVARPAQDLLADLANAELAKQRQSEA